MTMAQTLRGVVGLLDGLPGASGVAGENIHAGIAIALSPGTLPYLHPSGDCALRKSR